MRRFLIVMVAAGMTLLGEVARNYISLRALYKCG